MSAIVAYISPTTGDYTVLDFDIVSGEEHVVSAKVSEHTVEEGANISDHVRPELARVNLRVVVTDSPINSVTAFGISPAPLQGQYMSQSITGRTSRQLTSFNVQGGQPFGVVPNQVPLIGGLAVPTNGFPRPATPVNVKPSEWDPNNFVTVSGRFLAFPTRMERVKAVFANLCFLCLTGVPVEVTSDIRIYPRMLITSISAPRDGTNSIEFSIEMRELRTAKTQKTFVTRKPAAKPKEKRATPEEAKGKQAAPWRMDSKTSAAILAQDALQGTGPRIPGPSLF
jgi:hypothetical protein